jgi:ribonuclease HI
MNLEIGEGSAKGSKKKSSKEKAYSYVSLVEGIVMTHQTWAECEARVKGAKGAKFKKVFNVDEEKDLMNSLGKL